MTPTSYTFLVLAVTIALFIWGKIRSDLVAGISLLALFAGGILTTSETLSGFGDSTVIMIAALFVVGEGLSRTGVTAWLGKQIIAFAGDSPLRVLVVLMLGTALLSIAGFYALSVVTWFAYRKLTYQYFARARKRQRQASG
jgi:di/tricarboxylate transporter